MPISHNVHITKVFSFDTFLPSLWTPACPARGLHTSTSSKYAINWRTLERADVIYTIFHHRNQQCSHQCDYDGVKSRI